MQQAQGRRGNKYGARRTEIDGIQFDSAAEAARYAALVILERVGEIEELNRQVVVQLSGGITWRMDFTYREHGTLILEDVKGCQTQTYKVKKKILLHDIASGAIVAVYRETSNGTSTDYGRPEGK